MSNSPSARNSRSVVGSATACSHATLASAVERPSFIACHARNCDLDKSSVASRRTMRCSRTSSATKTRAFERCSAVLVPTSLRKVHARALHAVKSCVFSVARCALTWPRATGNSTRPPPSRPPLPTTPRPTLSTASPPPRPTHQGHVPRGTRAYPHVRRHEDEEATTNPLRQQPTHTPGRNHAASQRACGKLLAKPCTMRCKAWAPL